MFHQTLSRDMFPVICASLAQTPPLTTLLGCPDPLVVGDGHTCPVCQQVRVCSPCAVCSPPPPPRRHRWDWSTVRDGTGWAPLCRLDGVDLYVNYEDVDATRPQNMQQGLWVWRAGGICGSHWRRIAVCAWRVCSDCLRDFVQAPEAAEWSIGGACGARRELLRSADVM